MEQPKSRPVYLYLEPGPGGVYTVTSPDVPGLVAEGGTPEEILRNVEAALVGLRAAWEQLGVEIPPALRAPLSEHPQAVQMVVLT